MARSHHYGPQNIRSIDWNPDQEKENCLEIHLPNGDCIQMWQVHSGILAQSDRLPMSYVTFRD